MAREKQRRDECVTDQREAIGKGTNLIPADKSSMEEAALSRWGVLLEAARSG